MSALQTNTPGDIFEMPMAASQEIDAGEFVMSASNSSNVQIGSDSVASAIGRGIAAESKTNGSTAGAETIAVKRRGLVLVTQDGNIPSTTAVGTAVTIKTATSVSLAGTTTNDVTIGKLARWVSLTQVWIDLDSLT